MKILELNILEFGGLTDRRYVLEDGLNIFEGENEAGKTTLWLFIKFMLYGMPKKGHPERDKSINRLSHRAAGTMTVSLGSEKYRIERSFSENSRGKVTVYNIDRGERVFDGQEPGEAMLSVPRDIFENSCGIGQSMCASLGGEKGAAAIRNLLSSADESVDVEKAQKKLDAIRVQYRHRNGKGGKLYELSQRINDTEQRLERATESRLRISDLEDKLRRNTEQAEENEKKLNELRAYLGELQRLEILGRFGELSKNEARLTALKDGKKALTEECLETDYIPVSADIANLNMLADSADRAHAALELSRKKIEALEADASLDEKMADMGEEILKSGGAEALTSKIKGLGAGVTVGIIACTFACITAGIGGLLMASLSGVGAILLIAGGAVCALGVLMSVAFNARLKGICRQYGKKRRELSSYLKECVAAYIARQNHGASLADARAEHKTASEHAAYIAARLEGAVRKTSPLAPVDAESARAEASRLERFIDDSRDIDNRIGNLSAVIENERRMLSVYDEGQLRSNLLGIDTSVKTPEKAEFEKGFYEERAQAFKAKDSALRTELINLKAVNDDPVRISDSLAELRSSYAAAEEYYEALVKAIEGIERASASMQGNITPIIGKNAGRMMETFTDGGYVAVNMGRDMGVSLVDGDGLTTTLDMMSGGTKDVAYIALRISLMMQIFGEEMPPVMLDETLCQLDNTRMERVLSLIGRLCEDGCQCLLFTCHVRETAACKKLGIKAKTFEM